MSIIVLVLVPANMKLPILLNKAKKILAAIISVESFDSMETA